MANPYYFKLSEKNSRGCYFVEENCSPVAIIEFIPWHDREPDNKGNEFAYKFTLLSDLTNSAYSPSLLEAYKGSIIAFMLTQ